MALTLSHERIELIRTHFEQLTDVAPDERQRLLDALDLRDRALWQQVRSLLTVDAHAQTLVRRWEAELSPMESATRWERLGALAGWLLTLPPQTRTLHIDRLDNPLHDALLETLVIFQDATQSVFPVEAKSETAAAESRMAREVQVGARIQQYEVLGRLGEGGMGVVYRARDTRLGRTVALKFLPSHLHTDPVARERFEQEARAASSLDHPNVGYIHEISETEAGQLFIAMAYYAGETLEDKLSEGPLPVDEALEYARQVAEGLACAHEAGIIHRDIKPANVIVTDDGVAKILDFGLAKMHDVTLTRTKSWLGTVAYMSPEQVRGEAVDARTDIWALGALLYELIAGERAFAGAYETAVMYNVLNEQQTSLSTLRADCHEAVSALVDRCLQKAPSDRYPDVEALLADMEPLRMGRIGDTNHVATVSWPVRRALRSKMGRWTGMGLGAVALALLLWIAGGQVFTGNAAIQPRHLAVLPFQVIGDDASSDVYAAGLLETLTSKLTQLEQFQGALWVVPASEITAPMTPTDAQERFGVTMVVSGSIQLADEQVRLTLNLIDAKTRRQIGSEQIDHRSAGALALQDEAILMLARMLQVELQPEERAALTAGGTTAPAANDFYLRGRGYLRNQQSVADIDLAIGLFQKAIGRDSLFALARAGLGEAYWLKYRATDDVQWVEAAIQASQQALALNAELAPVHVTLGIIQSGRQRYDEALVAFQRALEIDPFNVEAYLQRGQVYRNQGAFERAEAAYKKAIELKPDYWRGYSSLGVLHYVTGAYEAAIEQYEYGIELAPANKSLLNNLGAAYWQLGRIEDAVGAFERILRVDPDHVSAQTNLATAYFYQGQYARAAELYEAKLARNPLDYSVQGFLADAYYWIPRRSRAEAAYRKAIELVHDHLAVRENEPDLLGSLASYHARLGEHDQAIAYLEQLESMFDPDQANVVLAFGMGEVYEHLGQRDDALRWMERALRNGYGWMQVRRSPWLQAFRDDAEVQAWLTTLESSGS